MCHLVLFLVVSLMVALQVFVPVIMVLAGSLAVTKSYFLFIEAANHTLLSYYAKAVSFIRETLRTNPNIS